MSIIMSTPVSTPAAPAQGQAVQAAQAVPAVAALPCAGGAAAATGTKAGAATTTATAGAQPAAAASAAAASAAAPAPFAQWLGRQADGSADAAQPQLPPALPSAASLPAGFAAVLPAGFAAVLPAAVTAQAGAVPAAGAPAAGDARPAADADKGKDAGTTQDNTLLAAMAMPLMPLTPMQIAQAVQIAQGGPAAAGSNGSNGTGDGKPAAVAQPGVDAIGITAAGQDAGRRAGIALPQLAAQPVPVTPLAAAAQPVPQDTAGVRLAVQAAGTNGGGNGAAYADAASQDSSAAAPDSAPATPAVGIAAAPAAAQPAADSVKLAGPPTAWRQSLQEALGDRLHVQVGKNVEQAVIRLEPPQLGRIDIAIRHSNGTLEVNISATHGEVLRQLQAVGDNLRNDLAQRQYVDVAVSVTPAPKSGNASPFGDPNQQQQQGRGRQQGRDQDEPGRALAEASNAKSAFSLGGREA